MNNTHKLIVEIQKVLGERLMSVILYGSGASEESSTYNSDVNLIVITDELYASDLKNCSKAISKWVATGNPAPIFLSKEEWIASTDIYPMEYADIKDRHRVLYGQNLVENIAFSRENLRLQCELETKNLLMRFRQSYLINSRNMKILKTSFIPIIKSCMAIFKAILRLQEIEIPCSPSEITDKAAELSQINKELFKKLLLYKEKQYNLKDKEITSISEELIDSLDKLLKYTDKL